MGLIFEGRKPPKKDDDGVSMIFDCVCSKCRHTIQSNIVINICAGAHYIVGVGITNIERIISNWTTAPLICPNCGDTIGMRRIEPIIDEIIMPDLRMREIIDADRMSKEQLKALDMYREEHMEKQE